MEKNARCLFSRRLCGPRVLGRKFGGEKILSLATEKEVSSVFRAFSIITLYTKKY